MRSRNIKPGFFLNSELSDVDYASRLLFIGLWCYADREGRFEWKPKQIKAAIFPYDNVNIEKLLCNLMSLHVITCHDKVGYIPCFKKHQRPHPHEAKSTLPEMPNDINVIACHDNGTPCQADIRNDDTIIQGQALHVCEVIIDDLNTKGGFRYKPNSATQKLINCRLKDGYTQDDFFHVHTVMIAKWKDDAKMSQYLRPATLYNASKFQGYLNTNPCVPSPMAGVR
jgi:uncharacterized phage protein (TIGR02220 family)